MLDFRKFIQHANKDFGQNFLIDKNILNNIVSNFNNDIKDKDCTEIGGGIGNLTYYILSNKPKTLTIIEKDEKYFKHLKELYNINLLSTISKNTELTIKNNDCLKESINSHIIISNLPYNISQLFLLKTTEKDSYNKMLILLQKEVGKKLTAQVNSKEYGAISVVMQATHDIKMLFNVNPCCFVPAPSVMSSLVYFERTNFNLKGEQFKKFQNFVFNIFKQRRRKLRNIIDETKIVDKNILDSRPEEISPKMYLDIFLNIN